MQYYFADWGKITDLHESTQLYRIMNPLQKDMIKYVTEVTGGKGRRLTNKATNVFDMAYAVQDKGDTVIGLTTMYAVMNHYKYKQLDGTTGEPLLDDKGNFIMLSAHDCYYQDADGVLQIKPDVEYDQAEQFRLKRIIVSELRRAQGNYASADQTKMEESPLGRMMFFFKKYLMPLMLNRFGYLKSSWETGEASLGYWRALAQAWKLYGGKQAMTEFFLGYMGEDNIAKLGLKGVGKTVEMIDPDTNQFIENKKVGKFHARKITQARRDAVAMMILSTASMLVLAAVKKKSDDGEEVSFLEGNVTRLIWGTSMEAMAMFPAGTGSQEYIKNFTTAVPMVKELNATYKLSDHLLKSSLLLILTGGADPDGDFDSEFYQSLYDDARYGRKSGPYEKGDWKLQKDLMDMTGLDNIQGLMYPSIRVDQLKKIM